VVQASELPAFENDHLAIDHLQPERLIEAGCESLPRARAGLLVHLHEPHIAVAGANRDAAIGQVIESGAEEEPVETVLVGNGERVVSAWPGPLAAPEGRDDRLAPAFWAALELFG